MNDKKQKDWHSAFAGGLSLSLKAYLNDIEIQREVPLAKTPPKMDALVIKKNHDVVVDNAIGRVFRKHNVVEYKNPNDALNTDVVYKVIGYAGYYKGSAQTVNAVADNELTITILRAAKPLKLFTHWSDNGKTIRNPYPGVYYIEGVIELPLQVIVTKELEDQELIPLKILMKNADEDSVRAFLKQKFETPGEREDADAVLQISVPENLELYERLRGDERMCQALRDLMKDEIDREVNIGRKEGIGIGREEGIGIGRKEGIGIGRKEGIGIGRKEGIGIGREEGIGIGRGIGRNELIADMLRNGNSPQAIADFSGIPIEQIQEVKNSMLTTA